MPSLYSSLQDLQDLATVSAFYMQFMPAILLTFTLTGEGGMKAECRMISTCFVYSLLFIYVVFNFSKYNLFILGVISFLLFFLFPKINVTNMESILH